MALVMPQLLMGRQKSKESLYSRNSRYYNKPLALAENCAQIKYKLQLQFLIFQMKMHTYVAKIALKIANLPNLTKLLQN